ncbi:hypothetical protein K2Z83_20650 [Oscillochloris sp. ZM17-4]|uniref:hypothetical protein n=1 Tax=Oscillochloris sp. ZM17-4 TaxID=2866714 RepID=UPI001C738DB7|nr:hypothetical protein [Oscillochloris sp. ZM17-4]MBX0330081.1 hypothetical protein [Oscillochloris sp. ZM17-4]
MMNHITPITTSIRIPAANISAMLAAISGYAEIPYKDFGDAVGDHRFNFTFHTDENGDLVIVEFDMNQVATADAIDLGVVLDYAAPGSHVLFTNEEGQVGATFTDVNGTGYDTVDGNALTTLLTGFFAETTGANIRAVPATGQINDRLKRLSDHLEDNVLMRLQEDEDPAYNDLMSGDQQITAEEAMAATVKEMLTSILNEAEIEPEDGPIHEPAEALGFIDDAQFADIGRTTLRLALRLFRPDLFIPTK